VSNKLNRPPKSTSLQELVRKPEKTAPQPASAVTETTTVTDLLKAEDLVHCWDTYAESIEKKIHLKNTMLSCKPVLQEDAHFEVTVHNPGQKEELINNSLELLKVLRTQLKNNRIQMHIRIDEANEKNLAYTSGEKYEFLNQINPLLSKLKDEFDLSID
jgi:DNA polymerase-3 subunit gamma/tau